MKEGYWLNWRTGTLIEIDEHERWLRSPGSAVALGIGRRMLDDARLRFTPKVERDDFLVHVMQRAPVMRIRGHIDHVTFEFHAKDATQVLKAVQGFSEDMVGPATLLNIHNFATGATLQVRCADIEGKSNDSLGMDEYE